MVSSGTVMNEMPEMLLQIEEQDEIIASFITKDDERTLSIHCPSWLPSPVLKMLYIGHEIGHLNYIERTGKAQTNPLSAVFHNLQAFRCELCSCNRTIALLLYAKKSITLGKIRPATFCSRLYLCDKAPSFLRFAFMVSAFVTIPVLRLDSPRCLRKNSGCLLRKIERIEESPL